MIKAKTIGKKPTDLANIGKLWLNLNEATAMRWLNKSLDLIDKNENLPRNQVARMWDVLDQLKRCHRKKGGEVAEKESKLRGNCKGLFNGCVSNFLQWSGTCIYIPH